MSGPSVARARRRKRDRRGVALVMVLGAITVLTVFLTDLRKDTASDLSAALAERDRLKAEYIARSAVNLSRLLIATEPTIRKVVSPFFMAALGGKLPPQLPVWDFSDMILGPFNDDEGLAAFSRVANGDMTNAKYLGLGTKGRFELRIVDEDSKININTAARTGDTFSQIRTAAQLMGLIGPPQYNLLFEGRDADNQFSDRATICGALIDWADGDENLFSCDLRANAPGAAGGEDSFYQMIGLSYRRKNAAFDSLEELRLVRGVGEDFWATFVDPDPSDPKKRLMTVWGQGKINVNYANPQTLLAIVCPNAVDTTPICVDPLEMEKFLMGVGLAKTMTFGMPLFTSDKNFVAAMKGRGMMKMAFDFMGVQPIVFKSEDEVRKQVTTESKRFSVYAEGIVPGKQRETRVRIHAVVDFSQALGIGEGASGGFPGAQPPAGSGAAGAGARANTELPGSATPEAIAAALSTQPGGNIVYWRVE